MFKLSSLFLAVGLGVFGCASQSDSTNQQIVEQGDGCTFTQGYWKNHPEAWPVSSIMLGNVSYSSAQALAIFKQPVKGNGLVALAHQLLAAKLNLAAGADGDTIVGAVAQADALIAGLVVPPIGSGALPTSTTSSLVGMLDGFNNGTSGPGHCGDTPPPPPPVCGDGMVNQTSEQCDDGNTAGGDGCSATCQPEPVCGDDVLDPGEQCDDGNTTGGDGCSASCEEEPACGDDRLDPGEQCDDGNTVDGDGCDSRCEIEETVRCGDGRLDPGEQCDDGNTTDGDGCNSRCECEPVLS